jgi:hypothetical protein
LKACAEVRRATIGLPDIAMRHGRKVKLAADLVTVS